MNKSNKLESKKLLSVYAVNQSIPQLTKDDIMRLNHLNIAFGYIEEGVISLDHLEHLERIKEFQFWNKDLKVYLSTASGQRESFGETIKTDSGLEHLTDSMIDIVKRWGFHGIDIDWEYPGTEEERHNHTILLKNIRGKLDALDDGKAHGLTIAAGSKTWYFEITELSRSVRYLDYVNLMTYDINANCHYTMHHACPTKMNTNIVEEGSTEENIEVFLNHGVPPEKLIIGAAFYSRQWRNTENCNQGLHSFAGEGSDYGPSYTKLMEEYVNQNGYTRYWDKSANAPYLFNGTNFITYEDRESLVCKCGLVKKWNIAGIMAWEYSYDQNHELLSVMQAALDDETL